MAFSRSYSARIAVATRVVHCTRRMLAVCGMVTLALCVGIAHAQSGTWTAPSGGYFYDSTNRSIRSLTGFIGSAVQGPAVATGIDWASLAPNQTSGLAQQNGSQIWIPDLSAAGTFQAVNRIPLALQAFWAADSSQAVILTEGGELVWLTNFSSGPIPVSTWNLKSYGAGSGQSGSGRAGEAEAVRSGGPRSSAIWSLLAADARADQVLLAVHTGEIWQIWFASSTIPPQNIPFSGRPAAAVFSPGAGGIFVADAASQQVVQIENPDTNPVVASVISSAPYVNELAALAVSSDGKRLFIADHSGSAIQVFDLSAGAAMAELQTSAAPVSFTAFSQDRYIVNTGGSAAQPIFFLNTGVPSNMSFVPGKQ